METKKKNMEKYKAYCYAMEKIDEAIEHRFPLEAIAIEESIISDRLRAYAEHVNHVFAKKQKFVSFDALIQAFLEELQERKLFEGEYKELYEAINKWRKDRNVILHGIVKTEKAGEAPKGASEDFYKNAMKAAERGREIAKKEIQIIRRKKVSSKVAKGG